MLSRTRSNGRAALDSDGFVQRVAEAFNRQGYTTHPLANGVAGSIYLLMFRDREVSLVRCKRRSSKGIRVRELKELAEVVATVRSSQGVFVSFEGFTPITYLFARWLGIRLLDGRSGLPEIEGGTSLLGHS